MCLSGRNPKVTSNGLVALTCNDFRLLLSLLDLEIEAADQSNSQVMATLRKARRAAERGLRLSERLAREIDGKTSMAP